MARIRVNYVSGTLAQTLPALSSETNYTTMFATSLAFLPDVGGGDTCVITLDPFGAHGRPETVIITAHSATVNPEQATILRAQEDSPANRHPAGTMWVHAPINTDFTNVEDRVTAIETTPGTSVLTASPIALVAGGASVLGTSAALSKADHRHAVPTGVAGASAPGDAASAGVASTFARSDHTHGRESTDSLVSTTRFVGEIVIWPGLVGTIPDGFKPLDGGLLDRTTYAALFALFGVTYNIGSGGENGTNFRLPDLRGRSFAGMDNMGTTGSANVVTAGTADSLGGKLGTETVTLTNGHLPVHFHGLPNHTHTMGDHTHNVANHVHDAGALTTESDTHTHDMTNSPLLSLEVVYGGTYGLPPGYGVNTRSRTTSPYSHAHDVTGFTASMSDYDANKVTSVPNAGGNTGSGGSGNTDPYPAIPPTPVSLLQPTIYMIPIIFTGVFS